MEPRERKYLLFFVLLVAVTLFAGLRKFFAPAGAFAMTAGHVKKLIAFNAFELALGVAFILLSRGISSYFHTKAPALEKSFSPSFFRLALLFAGICSVIIAALGFAHLMFLRSKGVI